MARGEIDREFKVGFDKLFDTICRYEDYPDFVDGVSKVTVDRETDGRARCKYAVTVVKDLVYVLDLKEDRAAGKISWSLVESDIFKTNQGGWTLEKIDDNTTAVHYEAEAEFKIPVPGFILKKLVKSSLPSMLDAFEGRAQES